MWVGNFFLVMLAHPPSPVFLYMVSTYYVIFHTSESMLNDLAGLIFACTSHCQFHGAYSKFRHSRWNYNKILVRLPFIQDTTHSLSFATLLSTHSNPAPPQYPPDLLGSHKCMHAPQPCHAFFGCALNELALQ